MNEIQRLTLLRAVENVIKQETSSSESNNLYDCVRHDAIEGYLSNGIKSRDVLIGGEKVGTVSIRMQKAQSGDALSVVDLEKFREWLQTDGAKEYIARLVDAHVPELLKIIEAEGEVPDGCDYLPFETPERPVGINVRPDPKRIRAAFEKGAIDASGLLKATQINSLMGEKE